jgi:DNA-binding transcriptional regulator YdaS (Cro superfamily)
MKKLSSGIEQAIDAVGSQEALASLLGCTQQNISFWKRKGYAPVLKTLQIEKLTGVSRSQLLDPRVLQVINADKA